MNFERFVAKKVFSSDDGKKGATNKIVSIAVGSIAVGLIVMILSIAILTGFKKGVVDKLTGMSGHIQVENYDTNNSFETHPVVFDSTLYHGILDVPGVTNVQTFATKPGIIKTENEIHGVVLKGVLQGYDFSFFSNSLVEGELPDLSSEQTSNDVLISAVIARKMNLKLGDKIYTYFYNEGDIRARGRRFTISGIYDTGMVEFDDRFLIADVRHVQKLNGWIDQQVSGYEITIDNFDHLFERTMDVRNVTLNQNSEYSMLRTSNVIDKYYMITNWLEVLDLNVILIIVLILLVAGFNMVSGLLIIIIDRTQMIGTLKAIGSSNVSVRKVFLYLASLLIGKGLFWGNLIGIGCVFIQKYTQLCKLDPATYYLDSVPVELYWWHLLLLNGITLAVILLILIIPTSIISKISPSESLKFQ